MPVYMKIDGVDGSSQAPAQEDMIIFSYSTGSSQAGADKGTWLMDVTYEDAAAGDGTSNTIMLAERYQPEDGAYVLTAIQHGSVDTLQTGFTGGVRVACGDVDGSTDTFEFHSYDGGTDGAQDTPGALLFTFDQEPSAQDTGSHVLYQDVVVPPLGTEPAVAMESLTIAHEGFWLI